MAGYIALVHKEEGTSYGVSFPDVPGCISAGDTFEEAVANAGEALAGHFALMRADGDAIPAPRTFEELKRDRAFVEDAADAIVTVVRRNRCQPKRSNAAQDGRASPRGKKRRIAPRSIRATLIGRMSVKPSGMRRPSRSRGFLL